LPPWATVTRCVTYSLKKRNDMFVLVATVAGALHAILQKLRKLQWPKIVEDMMRTGKLTQKITEPVLPYNSRRGRKKSSQQMQPMQEAEC
jgi:hypothetical protein